MPPPSTPGRELGGGGQGDARQVENPCGLPRSAKALKCRRPGGPCVRRYSSAKTSPQPPPLWRKNKIKIKQIKSTIKETKENVLKRRQKNASRGLAAR